MLKQVSAYDNARLSFLCKKTILTNTAFLTTF